MGCIHSTYIFKKRSRKNDELDESKYDGVLRGVENRDINIEWKDTKPFVVPLNGGHVIKVYDGDTIWVSILLNSKLVKFKCRMLGYDSPELKPLLKIKNRDSIIQKAQAAKNYLENLVLHKIVDIKFSGFDKYGRALSTLYIKDPDSHKIHCPNKIEVNTLMVRRGHGYSYMGGTKRN